MMPMRRFWFLNRQIDRIQAEQDLRHVQAVSASVSQDGYKKVFDTLQKTLGEIVVFEPSVNMLNLDDNAPDPEFDRVAFDNLKKLIRAQKHK